MRNQENSFKRQLTTRIKHGIMQVTTRRLGDRVLFFFLPYTYRVMLGHVRFE